MVATTISRHRKATGTAVEHSQKEITKGRGPDAASSRKKEPKRTPTLHSLPAQLLHDLLIESDRPIRSKTADSIIAEVEAYAVQVGYQTSITKEMIQKAILQPLPSEPLRKKSKTSARTWFVKVLQEEIAQKVYVEDPVVLELVCLIDERGLPSNKFNKYGSMLRIKMGPAKAVLRAKQALSGLRNWRIPCDFVLDAETLWRYSEKYGGLRRGVKHLGEEQEERLFTSMIEDHIAYITPSHHERASYGSFKTEELLAV